MIPVWIKKDIILAVHDELIAEHGGLQGIRDENALESSLNAPQNLFHYTNPTPSLEELACRYAYSLTSIHPFNDGNKRTAFFAFTYFLEENDIIIDLPKSDCYLMIMGISTKTIPEHQFIEWIEGKPLNK